jgi:hypothetical protein
LRLKAGTPDKGDMVVILLYNPSGHLKGWIVNDLASPKLKESGHVSRDGGKIVEKAKAAGNAPDSGYVRFPMTKPRTSCDGLNSTLLLVTHKNLRGRTETNYTRDRSYGTYRKDLISREWKANWPNVERKVRNHQMKLVELAQTSGDTGSRAVLELQRKLIIMKDLCAIYYTWYARQATLVRMDQMSLKHPTYPRVKGRHPSPKSG